MNIAFLGPPGAGKGTQALRLAFHLDLPHIETGHLLREAMERGTETGRLARLHVESGALVPDEVVIELVRGKLTEQGSVSGMVLDGFPRTLPQAEGLDEILREEGAAIDHVIDISVDHEIIVNRLVQRRVCSRCGKLYNLGTEMRPRQEGVCDVCGGELIHRDDDREDTIRNRLTVYEQQSKPVRRFYEDRDLLRVVDGTGGVEKIFQQVLGAIGNPAGSAGS